MDTQSLKLWIIETLTFKFWVIFRTHELRKTSNDVSQLKFNKLNPQREVVDVWMSTMLTCARFKTAHAGELRPILRLCLREKHAGIQAHKQASVQIQILVYAWKHLLTLFFSGID